MIEAAEEPQIFAAGKPSVEADVAPGVVAELAADAARVEHGIVSCDLRAAFGGEKKCGKNAQQGGFAGAVGAQQRQSFARTHFEGNPGQRYDRWFLEWLQKRPPAAARRRKGFLEISNANRGFRHDGIYSLSVG
jgi:hypothetical protein